MAVAAAVSPTPLDLTFAALADPTRRAILARLAREVPLVSYFKIESANPSGSYKDRFAARAIAHMLACANAML